MTEPRSDQHSARKLICVSAIGVILIGISASGVLPKKLAWNASPSLPIGLYLVNNRPLKRSDLVLAQLPDWAQLVANQRGYLPRNIPALKRISALSGDRVCRFGGMVVINGRATVKARLFDNLRRRMPVWRGCRTLSSSQVFLLADHQNSFDGRYIGVTETTDIIGTARLIWKPQE